MVYKSFDELFAGIGGAGDRKKTVAVMAAEDAHTLEAVGQAVNAGIVDAVLIGDGKKIEQQLDLLPKKFANAIIHASSNVDAVATAAELIKKGEAHFLLKGLLQTGEMMKVLMREESDFRTERQLSHLSIVQIPNYHKLIGLTDAALNVYPDLPQKKEIVINAVDAMHSMGFVEPKVAVLAPVEQVNPKIQETVDADALKLMNRQGELPGCIVDGPLSYDLAMNREAAEVKGIDSAVAGDVDLLVVPNLSVGNTLLKALRYSAKATTAGIVVGGKVPLVLTSRAAEVAAKYLPIVLAAAACARQ
ncbi:phosphate acyltransferase [Shumkonia mesophila]|uniref:phosphate acyltransferase n=1 Tax=Shumkonia mesophila TaxID=2838854 RepID=UPI00293436C8|nr:phosphate acyltransferase [Shumkonia mesophila]